MCIRAARPSISPTTPCAGGQAQVALMVGAERMTHEDKRVSFGALAKAVDLEEGTAEARRLGQRLDLHGHLRRKDPQVHGRHRLRVKILRRSWSRAAVPRR
ncbi:hypothetical protein ACTMU2_32190 [Cupriavidus basilensis]